MSAAKKPDHYTLLREQHPDLLDAVEALGEAAAGAGPLPATTLELLKLAAAAALRSEGDVRSQVRRALAEGASEEEISHALVGLTSTIGFPAVAAALSWAHKDLDG